MTCCVLLLRSAVAARAQEARRRRASRFRAAATSPRFAGAVAAVRAGDSPLLRRRTIRPVHPRVPSPAAVPPPPPSFESPPLPTTTREVLASRDAGGVRGDARRWRAAQPARRLLQPAPAPAAAARRARRAGGAAGGHAPLGANELLPPLLRRARRGRGVPARARRRAPGARGRLGRAQRPSLSRRSCWRTTVTPRGCTRSCATSVSRRSCWRTTVTPRGCAQF